MTAIASAARAGESRSAPSRRPRADHTEAGILAIVRPVAVTWRAEIGSSVPASSDTAATSTAPNATRLSTACRFGPAGRGSGSRLSSPPQTASARTAEVRSEVATSGGVCSGRLAQSASDMHRYATPGPCLAARPERCVPDAFDSRIVTSPDIRRFVSRRGPRESPESTTMRTPSMVSADSATDVETMTRRVRSLSVRGRRIASCSFAGVRPVSVCTSTAAAFAPPPALASMLALAPTRRRTRNATSSTSRAPGAKTSTSPVAFSSMARTVTAAR